MGSLKRGSSFQGNEATFRERAGLAAVVDLVFLEVVLWITSRTTASNARVVLFLVADSLELCFFSTLTGLHDTSISAA